MLYRCYAGKPTASTAAAVKCKFESITVFMYQEMRDQVMDRKHQWDNVRGTVVQRLHFPCTHRGLHSLTNNQVNENSSWKPSRTADASSLLSSHPSPPPMGERPEVRRDCRCRLNFIVVKKEEHGVEKVLYRMCGHWSRRMVSSARGQEDTGAMSPSYSFENWTESVTKK